MRCLVTAGPTCEPLDQVRRLTNFSTGRLGTELAGALTRAGHEVILLVSANATWSGPRHARQVEAFDTTESLRQCLTKYAGRETGAVFHAAAVSDFVIGRVWARSPSGALAELKAGKLPTRDGVLLAELRPAPKLIASLRDWFPDAHLVGWKYEVDGATTDVLELARRQIHDNRTDVCVANGPAYGPGFGWVTSRTPPEHLPDRETLFRHILAWLASAGSLP